MPEQSSSAPQGGPPPPRATLRQTWQEIAALWRSLPGRNAFLLMLAAWTAVFWFWGNPTFGVFGHPTPSLFEWMYLVFRSSDDDAHGLYVVPVVLALLCVKRRQLLAVPKGLCWPAAAVVLLAMLVHILGYLVQQPRISIAAYVLGVYGLTGLAWGWGWMKASFFPMFLLLYCVPLSGASEAITFPLRILVSKISVFLGRNLLGIPVLRDGVQMFSPTGGFRYEVAAACSGIRSLVALSALTLIYGFLNFRSPWRRLAVVASCVPLAILGNVLRLTTIIIVGEAFGQQAGMKIETNFGYVTLLIALGGVLLLGWWLREAPVEEPAGGATPAGVAGPSGRHWLALAAVVAIAVPGSIVLTRTKSLHRLGEPGLQLVQEKVFDTATNVIGTVTVPLPARVLDYRGRTVPISTTEVSFLPRDTTFARRIYEVTNGPPFMLSVILMGTDRGSIHKPQICLTGQGWRIERSELTSIRISRPHPYDLPVMKVTAAKRVKGPDGREIPLRSLYVYWFVADGQLTARHGERMWWMARDLLLTGTLQRWSYVSCWAQCHPGQEEAVYERMRAFLAASVPDFQRVAGPPK